MTLPPLVLGTAAMRNTKRGSWYIEALTRVFSERACDMHVADMLVKVSQCRLPLQTFSSPQFSFLALPTWLVHPSGWSVSWKHRVISDFGPLVLPSQVNALIKEREGYAPGTEFHRCKEMSEYCSTLCRQLYLFPGHPPT